MASDAPQGNPFAQLLAVAREVSYIKGAELVRQGEASRGAFLIRSGAVQARVALPGGGTLTVAEFRDGDMFGEMALIERGVVSATVVAHSNVDAWFVGRDDFRALVASREIAALETQRSITRTLADKLRALNERFREYPAVEDRPASEALPASDPLAGVVRSRRASFDWKAYLPVLPLFEGFDADGIDELAATGKLLELPRGAWIFASGLPAEACYIVLRGAVEIFTRNGKDAAGGVAKDRRVAIAGPGELVGFVALLRGATHGGNARARSLLAPRNPARRLPRNLQRRLRYNRELAPRHPSQPHEVDCAHQHAVDAIDQPRAVVRRRREDGGA